MSTATTSHGLTTRVGAPAPHQPTGTGRMVRGSTGAVSRRAPPRPAIGRSWYGAAALVLAAVIAWLALDPLAVLGEDGVARPAPGLVGTWQVVALQRTDGAAATRPLPNHLRGISLEVARNAVTVRGARAGPQEGATTFRSFPDGSTLLEVPEAVAAALGDPTTRHLLVDLTDPERPLLRQAAQTLVLRRANN